MRFMPPDVRVLDVGCGTEYVTLIANREKGNRVYGMNPIRIVRRL